MAKLAIICAMKVPWNTRLFLRIVLWSGRDEEPYTDFPLPPYAPYNMLMELHNATELCVEQCIIIPQITQFAQLDAEELEIECSVQERVHSQQINVADGQEIQLRRECQPDKDHTVAPGMLGSAMPVMWHDHMEGQLLVIEQGLHTDGQIEERHHGRHVDEHARLDQVTDALPAFDLLLLTLRVVANVAGGSKDTIVVREIIDHFIDLIRTQMIVGDLG